MVELMLSKDSEKEWDWLVQTVCILSKDTEMKFWIKKRTILVTKKIKIVKTVPLERQIEVEPKDTLPIFCEKVDEVVFQIAVGNV